MENKKNILVVEDERIVARELQQSLTDLGYEVPSTAASGEEAIRLATERCPDLVLMDIHIKGEQDGISTADVLHSRFDVPIVYLTAYADPPTMDRTKVTEPYGYLLKPVRIPELRSAVEIALFKHEKATVVREMAEFRGALIKVLETKNEELSLAKVRGEALARELEAFSYSVSHDLRAPLRRIEGFSQMLEEDCKGKLGPQALDYLGRMRAGVNRMQQIIDDMLKLSQVTRQELRREEVELSTMAEAVLAEFKSREPRRQIQVEVQPGLRAQADPGLLRILMENLLGNAWKFSSKTPDARIVVAGEGLEAGKPVFVVRDNGNGFDMALSAKLFTVFNRLHSQEDFPGTGVGLATVQRVVQRHGGRVWAEGQVGHGAAFYFTL